MTQSGRLPLKDNYTIETCLALLEKPLRSRNAGGVVDLAGKWYIGCLVI